MIDGIDTLPPRNKDAEEALLGGAMTFDGVLPMVRGDVQPADFYDPRNGLVYGAMIRLFDRGERVDRLTVKDELTRAESWEDAGGIEHLSRLAHVGFLAGNAENYARIIQRTAAKRRLISAAGKIAAVAYDDSIEVEDALAKAMALLGGVQATSGRNRIDTPEDQALLFLEMVEEIGTHGALGIPTGFPDLDRATGGFEPGELIVLMAKTGMGKSSLAQTIARNIVEAGKVAQFCSIEMPTRQLVKRNAASLLKMDWRELEYKFAHHQEDETLMAAVRKAAEDMAALSAHIYYKPDMTTADIRAKAIELKATTGLDFIVVDYLQIVTADRAENRNVQVGQICRDLKRIAGEMEVPLLALSQMNRDDKVRSDKRPTLTDARESGNVEQDSDIVMGIYRDDYYYQVLNEKKQPVTKGKAELIVLKQREGPAPVTVPLTWLGSRCTYSSYAEEVAF